MDVPGEATARSVTSFDEKLLFAVLTEQQPAYKLKLVYDSLDESDECPAFQMRAALKPLRLIVSENLECRGLETPPLLISVD